MGWVRLIVVASLYWGGLGHAAIAADSDNLELRLKATFLHKFADFVTWPPGAFGSETSPLNVCVAGRDPFGSVLDEAVQDQHVGTRPIAIKRLTLVNDADACHIMFVSGSSSQSAEQMLAALRGKPVLTVTDSAVTPGHNGIISFVVVQNRVRFTIDNQLAAADGLNISSKLLSVAVSVQMMDRSKAR